MSGHGLRPPVEALYAEWRRCWVDLDGPGMIALFTTEPGRLIYQPEEFPKPLLTMEKLRRYWTSVPAEVIASSDSFSELSLAAIEAGDLTIIEVLTEGSITLHAGPKISGVLRSTLVVETQGDQATILHYHESRHLKLGLLVA